MTLPLAAVLLNRSRGLQMVYTRALKRALILTACLPLLSATNASAVDVSLDLTGTAAEDATACVAAGGTVSGIYCNFAGALWTNSDSQSTGSGVIDSFVRISDGSPVTGTQVNGMNTSGNLTQDENTSDVFTHDITEGIVPIVVIDGVSYYEFLLDINQNASDSFLTLKELELCSSDTGSREILGTATTCAGTNFYSLGDNQVQLDYVDNKGSGSGDLFVYIPVPVGGIADDDFIYLWSQFGPLPNDNNDGYEEWAIRTPNPISAPDSGSTLSLLGLAMLGVGYLRRRQII